MLLGYPPPARLFAPRSLELDEKPMESASRVVKATVKELEVPRSKDSPALVAGYIVSAVVSRGVKIIGSYYPDVWDVVSVVDGEP